jgi:hypothetical protein
MAGLIWIKRVASDPLKPFAIVGPFFSTSEFR